MIRLLHTIRYLRAKQIYYRLYYVVRDVLPMVKTISLLLRKNDFPTVRGAWAKKWIEPVIFESEMMDGFCFQFLGLRGDVSKPSDWNNPKYATLWLYHLHYFNVLNSRDTNSQIYMLNGLIQRWIDENPPLQGLGWEPYPLSLRIVNWVKWFSKHDEALPIQWVRSLYLQVQALSKQIEYHLLANHLLANAKALIFAGAYFQGKKAERWLRRGVRILDRELNEQFLADGGHFELSPMYHAILLWDVCDLVQLAQITQLELLNNRVLAWQALIARGLKWLHAMTHPDGELAFFNDATMGVAPTFEDLKLYAAQLGIHDKPPVPNTSLVIDWLKETGYAAVSTDDHHKLICDVAKVGPDYQPGHAHADTLSFELSLYGKRVMVNSGISEYGMGSLRQMQRGTKAHNTVCIDGADSSEVWAGFRVARRAVPGNISIQLQAEDSIVITGCHNGYRRLPGKNQHHRCWQFSDNQLSLRDEIDGSFKQAEARFYLHPEVRQVQLNHAIMTAILPEGQFLTVAVNEAESLWLESSVWYPGFGQAINNQCLVVRFKTNTLTTQITW